MSTGIHWRDMTMLDLPVIEQIAAAVHPAFPESTAVLAERLRLYPDGARLLELAGRPAGYGLSHPWHAGKLPALDARLGAIPTDADTFYVHDVALLPAARRTGAGGMLVDFLRSHARQAGFETMSLVAVNNSQPFWMRHGFVVVESPGLTEKLLSYEPAARYMVKDLK